VAEPAVLDGKTEHAFERRKLPIDARVRRFRLLQLCRVCLDSIGCDVNSAVEAEKFSQVADQRRAERSERRPSIW
jgi:hypothetical protein